MSLHEFIGEVRTLYDYRDDIERYIRENGPYAHNLISLTLRQIERECGREAVIQAIEDYDLKKKFGISKRKK